MHSDSDDYADADLNVIRDADRNRNADRTDHVGNLRISDRDSDRDPANGSAYAYPTKRHPYPTSFHSPFSRRRRVSSWSERLGRFSGRVARWFGVILDAAERRR